MTTTAQGTNPITEPTGDTGSGFLVGTDPKESPAMGGTPAPPAAPAGVSGNESGNGQRYYTDDDLERERERVRREEKDKLYGRINTMSDQLAAIQRERETLEASRQAELEAAAADARAKEESEMETRDLLQRKEAEWQESLARLESRYEQDRAVFERERRFQEVATYRQARLEQESEWVIPELRDLIRGNSEEEVDASIEEMKARTVAIMEQLGAVNQQQRQGMRGAAPTAPPVGPMEQMESYESISPDDIRSMDMETYKRFRSGLLNATSRQYRGG